MRAIISIVILSLANPLKSEIIGQTFRGNEIEAFQTSSLVAFGLDLGLNIDLGAKANGVMINETSVFDYQIINKTHCEDGIIYCFQTSGSFLINVKGKFDTISIKQYLQKCSLGQDICYGKISVKALDITAFQVYNIENLIVSIDKGCTSSYLREFTSSYGELSKHKNRSICQHTKIEEASPMEIADFQQFGLSNVSLMMLTSVISTIKPMVQVETCSYSPCGLNEYRNAPLAQKSSAPAYKPLFYSLMTLLFK